MTTLESLPRVARWLSVSLVTTGLLTAVPAWRTARPDYNWSFPGDSWSHPGFRTEWWYFTGHLKERGSKTSQLGYQFTIFRLGLLPETPAGSSGWHASDLLMGHAVVSDFRSGNRTFAEIAYRAIPKLAAFAPFPNPVIAWSRGAAGSEDRWELRRERDGFRLVMQDSRRGLAIDLAAGADAEPLLQGPNGYSIKSAGGASASHYYSLPVMPTEGIVRLGGISRQVSGTSWMDQEFSSNMLTSDQTGWDWFSLRFDDGDVFMLFQLRSSSPTSRYASGTHLTAAGQVSYFTRDDFALEPVSNWKSGVTGALYPIRWRVDLPGGRRLSIEAIVDDQENVSRLVDGLSYWEGGIVATDASGAVVGRGYLEMTGYAPGSRPPL